LISKFGGVGTARFGLLSGLRIIRWQSVHSDLARYDIIYLLILIFLPEDGAWVVVAEWLAHQVGCNAVSWAPGAPSALIASAPQQAPVRRLATAGCDHLIKLWKYIKVKS
jgi:hypothetical protein